jgi:hypothetical protein
MQAETICLFLVDRILAPEASFDARLHLIYLINDILHNWLDYYYYSFCSSFFICILF